MVWVRRRPCAREGLKREREDKADRGVKSEADATPGDALGITWRLRVGGAENVMRNRHRKIEPHAEQAEPGKKLHPGELAHGSGHGAQAFEDLGAHAPR